MVAESIAFLGDPDDTVAFREDVLPARDSRGRFYLPDKNGTAVHVFGANGRLLTTFGRRGRGPGELSGLRAIYVTAGDSLLVTGSGVVHVFSPHYVQAREYRNMAGSPDEVASTIIAGGRLLIDRADHSFAIIDTIGAVTSRVKLREIDESPCGECGERVYREASMPGSVWSGPLNQYRVEQHDLTGALLQRFTRNVSWFSKWSATEIQANTIAVELGRPRLMGARQSSDGIVWTHITMIEHAGDLTHIDEDQPRQMAQVWARVITKIEAIDPAKQQVLAATTLTNTVFPLVGDYSAQLIVDDAGGWAWKILRFRVEQK